MRWLALGAGYVLLVQAIATSIEIVARKVFNHSFQGIDELGGYALAISGAVGFGYATLTCAHTRIDLLLSKLPLAGRAVLHMLAAAVLMIVAGGMFWYGLRSLRQSISFGSISTTPLQTPLWIPQGLWIVGLSLFLLLTIVIFARCLAMFARRDFAGVEAQMKAKSQEQQELEAAGFGGMTQGVKQ
ncbi:TRAP transporter small permease [Sedimentitalea sp. JM2-8]|uniref:TRAP transporter small permease protein n=1 Tax=Sedimentitalea xiamensis TaxID=3050037 RepID=A0ABT7FIM6_9RHOB|nr:TRAP transporter small permease [Sedimentitalea xiamensis]MDK3074992.1 TRAP transporter small permease [Sedimentitalea xiamensis]